MRVERGVLRVERGVLSVERGVLSVERGPLELALTLSLTLSLALALGLTLSVPQAVSSTERKRLNIFRMVYIFMFDATNITNIFDIITKNPNKFGFSLTYSYLCPPK